MFASKSSWAIAGALAVSTMMSIPTTLSAPAVGQSISAQAAEPFSFLGVEGELGVYALDLHSPPITIKAFLHPSGGMFITIRSKKNPSSSMTAALTFSPTTTAGNVTATSAQVETRILAVDAKGNTFLGIFVNGELKMIVEIDKNGNVVRTITV